MPFRAPRPRSVHHLPNTFPKACEESDAVENRIGPFLEAPGLTGIQDPYTRQPLRSVRHATSVCHIPSASLQIHQNL